MPKKRTTDKDLPERMYRKHGAFYFVDRSGKWVRLGANKADAIMNYGKMLQDIKTVRSVTMQQLFDRYEREVIPNKAPRTQQDNLEQLKKLRFAFNEMHPADIKPLHIYAYMDERGKVAKVRANREKALLSNVFSFAIRWGIVEVNPCQQVKGFTEKPRDRYVTDAEFWAVHDCGSKLIQIAMRLAWITGLRQGDILGLTYQDITDQGLMVLTAKTGKRLLFEWTPDLRGAIDDAKGLPRKVRGMHLLCTGSGGRYTRTGFASMWKRTVQKAMDKGTLTESFTFHDLRAKAGSDSQDDHLLGHADQRMLNRVYKRKPEHVTPVHLSNMPSAKSATD